MPEEAISYTKISQEDWYGKPKGLSEDLENAEKLQTIECPNCQTTVEFFPDDLYWDNDEDFEFCDVTCLGCNKQFELCAAAGIINYDFFTS